jgi:D-lactate dehydrogenase
MKTFIYSAHDYERPYLQKAAGPSHALLFSHERLEMNTAHYATGYPAVSVFTSDDCSGPVLDELHAAGVRYITTRSAGFDHINVDRATHLGMQVANVPKYSPYSVAEHAVAMLMTLNRKFVESRLLMELQDFRLDNLTGFDIHGKTVGIIGAGRIGMAFARIMKGFGATVLAYDPVETDEASILGIRYVSMENLLRSCDIVSIHCPLTKKSRHLISNTQFAWMKKGCILINTSRGAIINSDDLIEALEENRLGGACLDVLENEKTLFFENHKTDVIRDQQFIKLRSFKRVLITGHQGFLTAEALTGIAETTISNLDDWQSGNFSPNDIHLSIADALQPSRM